MESIRVAVRVRPLNEEEVTHHESLLGSPDDKRHKRSRSSGASTVSEASLCAATEAWSIDYTKNQIRQQITTQEGSLKPKATFDYNHTYPPSSNTEDIFEDLVEDIVADAVQGINGTVFAYGQTGSGKTHTMVGNMTDKGVIPLSLDQVFDDIGEIDDREFMVRVSFLEIYNERIRDLLADGPNQKQDLAIKGVTDRGVEIRDLSEHLVKNKDDCIALLRKGNKNRESASTAMNDRSSRSHAIFRLVIESKEVVPIECEDDFEPTIRIATLNLVDLAGSEKSHAHKSAVRQREGSNINKSLLVLSRCIQQLASAQTSKVGSGGEGHNHVPFRDSKLTRILQASLGGNAKTAVVCCITEAARSLDVTLSTLRFADRCSSVHNDYHVNEFSLDGKSMFNRHEKQIRALKKKLQQLREQHRIELRATSADKNSELSEARQREHELEQRLIAANEMVLRSPRNSSSYRSPNKPRRNRRKAARNFGRTRAPFSAPHNVHSGSMLLMDDKDEAALDDSDDDVCVSSEARRLFTAEIDEAARRNLDVFKTENAFLKNKLTQLQNEHQLDSRRLESAVSAAQDHCLSLKREVSHVTGSDLAGLDGAQCTALEARLSETIRLVQRRAAMLDLQEEMAATAESGSGMVSAMAYQQACHDKKAAHQELTEVRSRTERLDQTVVLVKEEMAVIVASIVGDKKAAAEQQRLIDDEHEAERTQLEAKLRTERNRLEVKETEMAALRAQMARDRAMLEEIQAEQQRQREQDEAQQGKWPTMDALTALRAENNNNDGSSSSSSSSTNHSKAASLQSAKKKPRLSSARKPMPSSSSKFRRGQQQQSQKTLPSPLPAKRRKPSVVDSMRSSTWSQGQNEQGRVGTPGRHHTRPPIGTPRRTPIAATPRMRRTGGTARKSVVKSTRGEQQSGVKRRGKAKVQDSHQKKQRQDQDRDTSRPRTPLGEIDRNNSNQDETNEALDAIPAASLQSGADNATPHKQTLASLFANALSPAPRQ